MAAPCPVKIGLEKMAAECGGLYFWQTIVLLWGHWHPYFGFLVTSPLGFKARVGSALFALSGGVHYTFPEIHFWCYMCRPLGGGLYFMFLGPPSLQSVWIRYWLELCTFVTHLSIYRTF